MGWLSAACTLGIVLALPAASPTRGPIDADALARDVKAASACKIFHPSRCAHLAAIVARGAAVGRPLLDLARGTDGRSRATAVSAVGHLGVRALGTELFPLMEDPDSEVRIAVIGAIGKLQPPGAVEILAQALGREGVNEKLMATIALGQTRSPGAVRPLLTALDHYHPRVKANATRALGQLADRRATLPIATLLADPVHVTPVRLAACEALGALGDPDGVPMLLQILGDPEVSVRRQALVALGRIGDARPVPALSLLVHHEQLALSAVGALGAIAHRGALPALVRVLKERKAPRDVLEKAFWAMGSIRAESAASALRDFMDDEDEQTRIWAIEALGRLGDGESSARLVALLRDASPAVKEMAVWSLQQISGKKLGGDPGPWERWSSRQRQQD